MLHRVVRPFPCSWDGLTLVNLSTGDEREFGDMAAGLLAEGYIESITDVPADEPGVAPLVRVVDAAEVTQTLAPLAPKRPYKKRG